MLNPLGVKMLMIPPWPLRYRISNWKQLSKCESNNSRDLHIVVTSFLNDKRISGTRIKVEHDLFGTMFSTIVDVHGTLVTTMDDGMIYELTTGQILEELRKWGFYVEYNPIENLSGSQLQYLMTLNNLHYDKIRILSVWDAPSGTKEFKNCVVGFNSEQNGDWLNSWYSPSKTEFLDALNNGTAINISAISDTQNYRWDWLYGWVGDINDILAENT